MRIERRALGPGEVDHELVWGLVGLSVLATMAAAAAAGALPALGPPCAFHALTGWPCPTCGSTRAALALLDLRVIDALRANPLAGGAGLLFPLYAMYALTVAAGRWPRIRLVLTAHERRRARVLAGCGLALLWAFLIVDGR